MHTRNPPLAHWHTEARLQTCHEARPWWRGLDEELRTAWFSCFHFSGAAYCSKGAEVSQTTYLKRWLCVIWVNQSLIHPNKKSIVMVYKSIVMVYIVMVNKIIALWCNKERLLVIPRMLKAAASHF